MRSSRTIASHNFPFKITANSGFRPASEPHSGNSCKHWPPYSELRKSLLSLSCCKRLGMPANKFTDKFRQTCFSVWDSAGSGGALRLASLGLLAAANFGEHASAGGRSEAQQAKRSRQIVSAPIKRPL